MTGANLTWAQAEELGRVMQRFETHNKKFSFCYSENFTDGPGYLLASHCSKVFVAPWGSLVLSSPSIRKYYLGDLLAHLGLKFDRVRSGEFKNTFTELVQRQMGKEEKQNYDCILRHIFRNFVASVCNRRPLPETTFAKVLEKGYLLTPEDAEAIGLIDRVASHFKRSSEHFSKTNEKTVYEEVIAKLEEKLGGKPTEENFETLGLFEYSKKRFLSQSAPASSSALPLIAVISVNGAILESRSVMNLIHVSEEYFRDKRVAGVILRVNCVGGNTTACFLLYKAFQDLIFETKKPLVVSVSDYAASGGFLLASLGEKIFVNPSSLTGSIGVITAHVSGAELLSKLMITEEIRIGQEEGESKDAKGGSAHGGFASPLSDLEKAAMERFVMENYEQFKSELKYNLRLDDVEALAKGRVWTGTEAVANGLAHDIGGLEEAKAYYLRKFADKASLKDEKKFSEIMSSDISLIRPTVDEMGLSNFLQQSIKDLFKNTQPHDWLYHRVDAPKNPLNSVVEEYLEKAKDTLFGMLSRSEEM